MQLPRRYEAHAISRDLDLSGNVDDPLWELAPWSDDFVDIEGDLKPMPRFRTRVKMLWNDRFFYCAADIEEPHVWATLSERDSIIFNDNDFEVFIDPDGDTELYAELEINALNTVWDLLLVKPYRVGGPAIHGWDIRGLCTAVSVQGTLNDPTDVDHGWRVEIAIPWAALNEISKQDLPPQHGQSMRVNFSRVEWDIEIRDGQYVKIPHHAEHNWVWSPQGVVDMHQPEQWGIVNFIP